MTNAEIIQKARDEIKLRGLSLNTELEYMGKLRVFIRHHENRPLEDMTELHIRNFLLYQLDVKKLSSGSLNIYNSALQFVFCAVMEHNLNLRMLPRRRVHKELPSIMSRNDIVKFFSCIDNLRDRTIFGSIYGAGLRVSEVAHLRVQDIDSEGMRLFVHQGKGGKDRYTLLSQRNLELLREYWTAYRPKHPEGYLFYTRNGKEHNISVKSIQDAFHNKERWIDAQKADILNVGYFHVVFTVPHELNSIIHANQEACYNLLFRSVTQTLKELAGDKKYLGAEIGLTAVLHTWGQNLSFHPHIHCIVPAGGLTKLGKWQPSRKKFFLPVKVLSRKFRGKFLEEIKKQFPDISQDLLTLCYSKEWVVYCKPPFKDASCVVEYLGRYTHRVAISNHRILKLEDTIVSFKWRDYKDSSRWKVMDISAHEFIRRFLMHVLPQGFMKIRHFGFLSSRGKQVKLKVCKKLTRTPSGQVQRISTKMLLIKILGRKPTVCPKCGFDGLLRTGLAPPTA